MKVPQKRFLMVNSTIQDKQQRPRTRWENIAQTDALQVVGIRGWWRRDLNRQKWRCLFEGGHGPKGAVVPYMGGWTVD